MSSWLDFWAFTVLAWVQSLVGEDPTSHEEWSKKKKSQRAQLTLDLKPVWYMWGLSEVGMKNNLQVYCNSHSKLSVLSRREKDQEAEAERLP